MIKKSRLFYSHLPASFRQNKQHKGVPCGPPLGQKHSPELGMAFGLGTGSQRLFFRRVFCYDIQMTAVACLGLQFNVVEHIVIALLTCISTVSHIVVAPRSGTLGKIFLAFHRMVTCSTCNIFFVGRVIEYHCAFSFVQFKTVSGSFGLGHSKRSTKQNSHKTGQNQYTFH